MAYDKNIASGTIFDEIGYDEMQKAENHEIGFRLFRIMFFVVLVFSFMLTLVCAYSENVPGVIISFALMAVTYGFYILYAYMTAKKGIMNPKFAKGWSAKWVFPVYIVLLLVWIYKIFRTVNGEYDLSDIAYCSMWLIILTGSLLMSLCARKNNRVLKKQLDETD
ncbi:MAG: hypothetical protein ACI4JK_11225 [Oscillospiraceae bacterium]